jgi:hypothetical protein
MSQSKVRVSSLISDRGLSLAMRNRGTVDHLIWPRKSGKTTAHCLGLMSRAMDKPKTNIPVGRTDERGYHYMNHTKMLIEKLGLEHLEFPIVHGIIYLTYNGWREVDVSQLGVNPADVESR